MAAGASQFSVTCLERRDMHSQWHWIEMSGNAVGVVDVDVEAEEADDATLS